MDGPSGGRDQELEDIACFMAAASIVGAQELRIAAMLGLNHGRVSLWAENLRRGGLWLADSRVVDGHWLDDDGEVGFMVDLLVAQGHMERVFDPVNGPVHRTVRGRNITN